MAAGAELVDREQHVVERVVRRRPLQPRRPDLGKGDAQPFDALLQLPELLARPAALRERIDEWMRSRSLPLANIRVDESSCRRRPTSGL
jgi:hypothetical protein